MSSLRLIAFRVPSTGQRMIFFYQARGDLQCFAAYLDYELYLEPFLSARETNSGVTLVMPVMSTSFMLTFPEKNSLASITAFAAASMPSTS